jgi:hypothetical protein
MWYQNDDDVIAVSYIEKMGILFWGNADCSSVQVRDQ